MRVSTPKSVRLTGLEKQLEIIKKKIGVTNNSEVIRYAIKYTADHVNHPQYELAEALFPSVVKKRLEGIKTE